LAIREVYRTRTVGVVSRDRADRTIMFRRAIPSGCSRAVVASTMHEYGTYAGDLVK